MTHPLPAYAYIPGKTPRHPEGTFDDIISFLPDNIKVETLCTLPAFQSALNFMDHDFHWEAHEIMEAIWMNTAQNSVERLFVQCVIHLANANLKRIMKREAAAKKIMTQANSILVEVSRRAPESLAKSELEQIYRTYAL